MSYSPYFEAHPYDIMAPWGSSTEYGRHFNRPLHPHAHSVVPRAGADITLDKNKFQVSLDVHQFKPSEISVKTVDGHVVVEGKHEEKEDQHGSVYRHFVRKYILPEGHKSEDVTSTLSSDGVLCVTAPKNKIAEVEGERIVHIAITGSVHGAMKNSSGGKPTSENVQ